MTVRLSGLVNPDSLARSHELVPLDHWRPGQTRDHWRPGQARDHEPVPFVQ